MENQITMLIIFFIIYSFLGWVMESAVRTICEKKLINTGFLYGPFCPIYGIGALIMCLFLEKFEKNVILLFIVSFIVLSIWEYIVGWLLEKIFKTKYWDYSNHRFNIKGRVCLSNSICWGILGVIFIKYIHPFISELIYKIPEKILILVSTIIGGYILIDAVVTIIKVGTLEKQINKLSTIGKTIKEKLEELKETTENLAMKQITKDDIEIKLKELKYQQTKLKRKVLKRTNRLKKAFPTMNSKVISDFLNQKIDEIEKNRKRRGN